MPPRGEFCTLCGTADREEERMAPDDPSEALPPDPGEGPDPAAPP